MYLYNVGYGTCEESDYVQFFHEKKFSKEELASIVEECLYECLKAQIEIESNFVREYNKNHQNDKLDWFYKGCLDLGDIKINQPSFQDLFTAMDKNHNRVFNLEMAERGFKLAEFEQSFSVFGWSSSVNPHDWEGYAGEFSHNIASRFAEKINKNGVKIINERICKEENEDSVS